MDLNNNLWYTPNAFRIYIRHQPHASVSFHNKRNAEKRIFLKKCSGDEVAAPRDNSPLLEQR